MDTTTSQAPYKLIAPNSSAPKVSVIIPLYYAEEYVDNLLGWLYRQPLKEIEIICVIDGSPDNTLALVQKHAEQDPRIRWVYQKNAGAGAARNTGLGLARGDYLSFIDADDIYDTMFIVKMYQAAVSNAADLVICQMDRIDYETGDIVPRIGFQTNRIPANRVFSSEELAYPFSDLTHGPTNKLFRREMVEREGLFFSETMVANDVKFVLQSIVSSTRIFAIAESLIEVHKFINPHSISSNRAQHIDCIFDILRSFRDWLCERGLYERYTSSYADVWTIAFHSNSSYGGNVGYIEAAARVLATEEPWSSMSDKELFDAAQLDTSMLLLDRAILRCLLGKNKSELKLQRIDNRLLVIREVVHILNSEYGKHLPKHSNLPKSALAYLRRNGLRHYTNKLPRYIRKLTKRSS